MRDTTLSSDITVNKAARVSGAKLRGLAAIKRVRRGQSKSLSAAARAEGTSIRTIQKLLPAALIRRGPGRRIRVKAGDSYSAAVEILTESGPIVVLARGSHQRDLAGKHRAAVMRVQAGHAPGSALEEFRGKRVGGHELITDLDKLSVLAQAGVLSQLDSLYATPEASA
jgi:hypothetical protein